MSHELTIRANGKVEMAFAGETPWHGLGTELERGATIESWIESAGMDWRVRKAFVRYPVSMEQANSIADYRTISDRVVLFRSDTGLDLGIVSDDYKIVQPQSVVEFFRDLCGSAGMELETAGTLFGGRKLWAMARVAGEHPVSDARDKMKMNLLLATSLDGSMATTGSWIATRVVCNNTLRISQGEKDALRVKVRHSTRFDADKAKAELGLKDAETAFQRVVREMREMSDKRMKESDVVLNTARLFYPDFDTKDTKEQQRALNTNNVSTISNMALEGSAIGSDMDGARGTVFGWLNSVTQFVDHSAGKKNTTADNRINSAWFGPGADLKEKAYAMALDYTPSLQDIIDTTNASFRKPRALLDDVLENTSI